MKCLISIEAAGDDTKALAIAKTELVSITSELMPDGKPAFPLLRQLPPIKALLGQYGRKHMLKVLLLMVKDLCSSVNAVRNMNEWQMIEAAAYLLDECGNMRLEDYSMMFALGKRGQLVKILDRLDVQVIGEMMEAYWKIRHEEGRRLQENDDWDYKNFKAIDKPTQEKPATAEDQVALDMAAAMTEWRKNVQDWEEELKQARSHQNAMERRRREEHIMKTAKEYAEGQGLNWDELLIQFKNKGK